MRRDLTAKRAKILTKISLEEYRELLKFVEDVYLADYALKILLARKCSCLFLALLELAREEDGGRVRYLYRDKFPENSQPIVISDRAVEYFADDIKQGRFAKILIADDVIIHGTTIAQLYDRLEALIQDNECEIDIRAYAINKSNLLEKEYLENARAEKKCDAQELRVITDEIVDIFRLTGQPFTSYVPNIVLKGKSQLREQIQEFAETSDKTDKMEDTLQNLLFPISYAWIDSGDWSFSLFQSIRFYINDDLEQCTIVPMVSLMPVKEEVLSEYGEILKEFMCEDYYNKISIACEGLKYKLIVYAVSSLWCRLFFRKHFGCPMPAEDLKVEKVNFGEEVLNREKLIGLEVREIENILCRLESAYREVEDDVLLNLCSDFRTLQGKWNMAVEEYSGKEVMSFLRANGELEEEMWEGRRNNTPIRLAGFPLCCVLNREKDALGNRNIIIQILKAIDFGYGSIIAKAFKKGDTVYYVSLLHSGERNYKYTEMRYFPFLYGLFEVEKAYGNAASKLRFMEEYINKNNDSGAGNCRENLEKLCNINITREYKSVLIRDAWYYPDQKGLERAINLADEIMKNNR